MSLTCSKQCLHIQILYDGKRNRNFHFAVWKKNKERKLVGNSFYFLIIHKAERQTNLFSTWNDQFDWLERKDKGDNMTLTSIQNKSHNSGFSVLLLQYREKKRRNGKSTIWHFLFTKKSATTSTTSSRQRRTWRSTSNWRRQNWRKRFLRSPSIGRCNGRASQQSTAHAKARSQSWTNNVS